MRLVPLATLCRAGLVALPLVALLPGCAVTAPAASNASTRRATASAPRNAASLWAGLQAQVGSYPTDGTDFLRAGPLADRLQGLLGATNYPVLLANFGVSGPLRQEGAVLYITGKRLDQSETEAVAVVIHPEADAVRVWLLSGGEEWDVQDFGGPKTLPAEVRKMMENARR